MTVARRRLAPVSESTDWLVTFDPSAGADVVMPGPAACPQLAVRGHVRVLFDGHLYNGEELRHLLGVPPARSQAELLIPAYEVWGRRLLTQLKGEFALVVVDEERRSLLAARDRVGSWPLYFRENGSELEVAKGIAAFAGRGLTVDPAAVSRSLAGKALPVAVTPYRGVRRLPPGHSLHCDGKSLTVERYWRPPVPADARDWLGVDDIPLFDDLLEQAVARAVTGRSAIFLSGGIDSVSVAATAADVAEKLGSDSPLALSLHYPGETEEPPLQRSVAQRLGLEHLTIDWSDVVGDRGLFQLCLETAARSSLPIQNPWRPATDALSCLARSNGCAGVVTGGGGDEWLTVDSVVAADYLRSGNVLGLIRYLSSVRRSLELPAAEMLNTFLWRQGVKPLLRGRLPSSRQKAAPAIPTAPDWLVPVAQEPVEPHHTSDTAGSRYLRVVDSLPLHPRRAVELDEKFEASRQSGLRHVDIYWDADLIEFLCRLPPHLLYLGGRTKGLVRERLSRRFPGLGFERQKKVVRRDLLGSTLLRDAGAAWNRMGGALALTELGLVEPTKLEVFVRRSLQSSDINSVDTLWRLFSLEAWARPRI